MQKVIENIQLPRDMQNEIKKYFTCDFCKRVAPLKNNKYCYSCRFNLSVISRRDFIQTIVDKYYHEEDYKYKIGKSELINAIDNDITFKEWESQLDEQLMPEYLPEDDGGNPFEGSFLDDNLEDIQQVYAEGIHFDEDNDVIIYGGIDVIGNLLPHIRINGIDKISNKIIKKTVYNAIKSIANHYKTISAITLAKQRYTDSYYGEAKKSSPYELWMIWNLHNNNYRKIHRKYYKH